MSEAAQAPLVESEHSHLLPGFKMTEIGPLPDGWKAVPVGKLTLRTVTCDPRSEPESHFNYIDVSSVSNEAKAIRGSTAILGKNAPSRARKLVRGKDVIFATVRPYLQNIAQVPVSMDGSFCSTGFCVLRANPDVLDADFLFYTVVDNQFVRRVVAHQRGSGYPAVSDKVVLGEAIAWPPLTEQRKIAAVLTTVRRAIEATERVIVAAEEVKKSLMRHLFTYGPVAIQQADQVPLKETEIGPVPAGWEVIRFNNSILKIRTKVGKVPRQSYRERGRFPVIDQSQEFIAGYADNPELVYQGDLPVIVFGDHTRVFKLVDLPFICGADGTKVLIPNRARFDARFLYLALSTLDIPGRGYNRHYSLLREKSLPCPPRQTQIEIVNRVTAIDPKIASEESRKAALESLFKTLLHLLMTGELRVNNWEALGDKTGG